MGRKRLWRGELSGQGLKIGIAVSEFNSFVTKNLLEGAKSALRRYGVKENDIDVIWVPGAFELPAAVKALADSQKYDGIIPLGCVIRGQTPHFEYISTACTTGLAQLSVTSHIPIVFGVLTCDTVEQAIERSSPNRNKGIQAAESLLKLIDALKQFKERLDSSAR